MITIEEVLQEEGCHISIVVGTSMYPMLRQRVDTVAVEKLKEPCVPMDVALYRMPSGKYVLHRVLRVMEKEYLICGDNCIRLEHIPKEWVIGKLAAFYRGERKIRLDSAGYRAYVLLWCRPYRMRIGLLRCRRALGRLYRKVRG